MRVLPLRDNVKSDGGFMDEISRDNLTAWRFSTEGVAVDRRPQVVRKHMAALVDVDVKPVGNRMPIVAGRIHLLPSVSLARTTGGALRLLRTAMCCEDGNDDYILVVPVRGACRACHRGGNEVRVRSGQAYLVRNDTPGHVQLARRCLHLVFDRRLLEPSLSQPGAILQQPLQASPELQLLTDYATALLRQRKPCRAETASLAATQLRELAVLALNASGLGERRLRPRGVRAERLDAVKTDIAANLHRPGLTAKAIAGRHGISPRYLRALFADQGDTFNRYVRDQRLTRAYRLLTDPRRATDSINVIALDSGFGDLSYFNRCFRRRFGCTPSEVRPRVSASSPLAR